VLFRSAQQRHIYIIHTSHHRCIAVYPSTIYVSRRFAFASKYQQAVMN